MNQSLLLTEHLSRSLPFKTEAKIRRRWEYWRPWTRLRHIAYTAEDHRRAVLSCLSVGLSWQSILRSGLDDPSLSSGARAKLITMALERRRRCILRSQKKQKRKG